MSYFDHVAKSYDLENHRLKRAEFIAEQIRSLTNKKGTLLDFGAGTGLLGQSLQSHFKEVYYYDPSKGMQTMLVEKFGQEFSLTELTGSYDVIATQMVMHHVSDLTETLVMLMSHLNEDGELFIADLKSEDGSFHGQEKREDVFHNGFDPSQLAAILENMGYQQVQIFDSFITVKHDKEYPLFLIKAINKKNCESE